MLFHPPYYLPLQVPSHILVQAAEMTLHPTTKIRNRTTTKEQGNCTYKESHDIFVMPVAFADELITRLASPAGNTSEVALVSNDRSTWADRLEEWQK